MTASVQFSGAGDVFLPAGQALTVERVFRDSEGAPVDLTGRLFTLTVFAQDGSVTPISVDATVSGSIASMTLTSDMTRTLRGYNQSKALGWQIVEHLAGGGTSFAFGPRGFGVGVGADASGGVASVAVAGAPVVQISGLNGSSVVTISSLGSSGLSTYEIWIARGNTGSVDDFLQAQKQPALDAAGLANTAAEQANAAASDANQKGSAAQGVVDQQTATLAQVAQARDDALLAREAAGDHATDAEASAGAAGGAAEAATTAAGTATQKAAATAADRTAVATALTNIQSGPQLGSVSGSIQLNLAMANSLEVTATGDILVLAPSGGVLNQNGEITVIQDNVGGHAVAFDPQANPPFLLPAGMVGSKSPGAVDVYSLKVTSGGTRVTLDPGSNPLGGMALKTPGTGIVDIGGGIVEALVPVQTIVGAGFDFKNGRYRRTVRSNAGAAMTDIMAAGAGKPNGAFLEIVNADVSASITMPAPANETIGGAATLTIPAGQALKLVWDGLSNHLVQGGLPTPALVPYTPTLAFVSPGDSIITYTTQVGYYARFGPLVFVVAQIVAQSNAYTTAATAGALKASLPVTGIAGLDQGLLLTEYAVSPAAPWPLAAGELIALDQATRNYLLFEGEKGSSTAEGPAGVASFPASSTLSIRFSGWLLVQ